MTRQERTIKRIASLLEQAANLADAIELQLPNGGIVGALVGQIAADLTTEGGSRLYYAGK